MPRHTEVLGRILRPVLFALGFLFGVAALWLAASVLSANSASAAPADGGHVASLAVYAGAPKDGEGKGDHGKGHDKGQGGGKATQGGPAGWRAGQVGWNNNGGQGKATWSGNGRKGNVSWNDGKGHQGNVGWDKGWDKGNRGHGWSGNLDQPRNWLNPKRDKDGGLIFI